MFRRNSNIFQRFSDVGDIMLKTQMIDIGSTFENCFEILLRCILWELRVGTFTSQSSDQIRKLYIFDFVTRVTNL